MLLPVELSPETMNTVCHDRCLDLKPIRQQTHPPPIPHPSPDTTAYTGYSYHIMYIFSPKYSITYLSSAIPCQTGPPGSNSDFNFQTTAIALVSTVASFLGSIGFCQTLVPYLAKSHQVAVWELAKQCVNICNSPIKTPFQITHIKVPCFRCTVNAVQTTSLLLL